jgi:hypothetical protein
MPRKSSQKTEQTVHNYRSSAKKNKTSHDTHSITQPPKEALRYDKWNKLIGHTWRDIAPSQELLKSLAEKLREWANTDTALRFDDFLDEYCVPWRNYGRWREKSEALQEAHEYALRRLASRRWHMAFKKMADKDIFRLDQHRYDPDWHKDVNEYWAALKREHPEDDKQIRVIIEQIETEEVPPKITAAIEKAPSKTTIPE